MPHHITNRKRSYQTSSPKESFLWEGLNAFAYIVGAVTFVIGSIFFLPAFEQYIAAGAWLFIIGSFMYLVVTAHDCIEVISHYRRHPSHGTKTLLEFVMSAGYIIGSVLFLIGSALFLPSVDWEKGGAWCFIIGSVLFTIGATVNVTQITQAGTLFVLQLLNAVAISFIVGSILFVVASIPYLWPSYKTPLAHELHTYLGAQFIFASFLFLVGGVINGYRAYRAHQNHQIQDDIKNQSFS